MKTYRTYIGYGLLSAAIVASASACKSNQNPESGQVQAQDQNPSQDPAAANVAPVSNESAQSGGYEASAPAPSDSGSSPAQGPAYDQGQSSQDQSGDYDSYDQPVEYAPQPPPPLPEYDQPPCPGDDYIWTPGYWYWAQDAGGYYWVPGAWVYAPYQGALWTPGYWGYDRGRYGWHRGYWGRHIGYYGGVDYGFGYIGFGYQGGYWRGDHFDYNRSVNNVDTNRVHNVYNYRVQNQARNGNRLSYNGPGGIQVRPRPAEMQALHEQHTPPMSAQMQQVQAAKNDRGNFARENHGRPQNVAVAKPLPADHNIHPPAPVPMRGQPGHEINGRPNEPSAQPKGQEPAARPERQGTRPQPTQRVQEPTAQQQHPAPVQRPERQQPAPERQAPERHAQPAPERQAQQQHAQPAPERQAPQESPRRTEQQRPAPVERPQRQQPAPAEHPAETRRAPQAHEQHAAPKPEPQHKAESKPKPPEKDKHPQ